MLQENTKMLERTLSDKQSIKLLREKEETTTREQQEVLPKVQSARKTMMIEEVTEGNESDEFTKCFPDWSRQVFIDPYEVRMLERRKREAEERRKEEIRERTRLAAEQQERKEREEEKRRNDEAKEEKQSEALKEVLVLPDANQEISLSFQEEIQEPHFEMSKPTQDEANHDKGTVLIEALEDILSKLKLLTGRVDTLCEAMPAECLVHTKEDVGTGEANICLVLKNQPQQQGLYTTEEVARIDEILFIPNKDGVDTVQTQEETGIFVTINCGNEIFPHGTVKNAEEKTEQEERESCECLKENREDAEEISRDCKGKTEGVKFNSVDLNCYEDGNYANSCLQEEMPVMPCTKAVEEREVQCNIGEVEAVIQMIEQQRNDPDTPHMTEKPIPQNREECGNSVVNRFLNSNDMELEEHTVERDKTRNKEMEENFKDRQEVERHNGPIESMNEQRKEDMKELKSEKAEKEKEEPVAKEVQKDKELVDYNNKECERIEASKVDKKIYTAKGDNNDSFKTLPAESCDKEQQKITANSNQEVKPLEKSLKAAEHPARGSALVMRERLRRAIGITEGMVAHAKASDPASKQESGKEREADSVKEREVGSVTRSDRARVEEKQEQASKGEEKENNFV